MRLSIFIPGDPVAQPRPRFRVVKKGDKYIPVPYTPKGHPVQKWRKILQEAMERLCPGNGPDGSPKGNVVLNLEFNIARPAKHFGTGRNKDVLKTSAPDAHIQKPDLDNLAKPVMDEMVNAGWLKDDSQVDELKVGKYWCLPPVGNNQLAGVEIEMDYD